MTLEQAGQLCFDQVPLIEKPLPLGYWPGTDWRARVRHLIEEETRHKLAVNQAMRKFCATRSWLALAGGSPTFLACARLQCAADTVNILLEGTPPLTLSASADSAILNWLLLETWNGWRWDSWLKLHALRSLGGEGTFYGKPPLEN